MNSYYVDTELAELPPRLQNQVHTLARIFNTSNSVENIWNAVERSMDDVNIFGGENAIGGRDILDILAPGKDWDSDSVTDNQRKSINTLVDMLESKKAA